MKPFRKHVAVAIDGGGIKGVIVTRALAALEQALGKPAREIFELTAGTSTGSIISAGIGAGLSGAQMHQLYIELGETIFKKSWRTALWPLTRYRYPHDPLANALGRYIGGMKMGDFWTQSPPIDVVITAFDLVTQKTCFIKPWKPEYREWPVITAVLASSSVPTYFPVVEGRYIDGGVGSFANPCYIAAYEARLLLGWKPEETTLLSFGTGRDPHRIRSGEPGRYWAWQWLEPILGSFLNCADDQQVHLVRTFFEGLDFRRFQIDLKEPLAMDDPSRMDTLLACGEELGQMVLNDQLDGSIGITPLRPEK